MTHSRLDVPVADDFSQPFWDAAREGRLLIQRCPDCEQHQFYPRPHCIHCYVGNPEWVEAKGTGRLVSYTVLHRVAHAEFANKVPYAFAMVELDEGVRLSTNIVESDFDALACDLPVEVVFEPGAEGFVLPKFKLAG